MTELEKNSAYLLRNSLTPILGRSKQESRQSYHATLSSNLLNVQLSTNKIIFNYRGTLNQFLYNRELKITNHTGTKIHFKIKCNSPENYEVMPNNQNLDNGKSLDIRIRLYAQSSSLQKYSYDRFLIEWGRFEQNQAEIAYVSSAKLSVEVNSEVLCQEITEENIKQKKDILLYQSLLAENIKVIEALNVQIKEKQQFPEPVFISRGFACFIGALFFLLGYWLA